MVAGGSCGSVWFFPGGAFLFADKILGGFDRTFHAAVLCSGECVHTEQLQGSDVLAPAEGCISGSADLVKAVFIGGGEVLSGHTQGKEYPSPVVSWNTRFRTANRF